MDSSRSMFSHISHLFLVRKRENCSVCGKCTHIHGNVMRMVPGSYRPACEECINEKGWGEAIALDSCSSRPVSTRFRWALRAKCPKPDASDIASIAREMLQLAGPSGCVPPNRFSQRISRALDPVFISKNAHASCTGVPIPTPIVLTHTQAEILRWLSREMGKGGRPEGIDKEYTRIDNLLWDIAQRFDKSRVAPFSEVVGPLKHGKEVYQTPPKQKSRKRSRPDTT